MRKILLVLFAVFALSLDATDKPAVQVPMKRIGVEEFDQLRSNKTNVVLDVRTAKEFKAAHIPGAINIDINAPDFEKQVAKLDKDRVYLVHCTAGVRSRRACKRLDELGFKNLFDLAPGFSGWEKAGKPVKK